MGSVKTKVFLGYFTLIILASFTVWIIYSEILNHTGQQVDLTPANRKIMYINTILTNLYQAEGLGRNYAQTGQLKHYRDYQSLMDSIGHQIDSLASMANNPVQQMHTDSIKKLLMQKHRNLKELTAIKQTNSSSVRYNQALEKISSGKDSIDHYLQIYKKATTNYDSVYVKQKKKKFFQRLADVFSAGDKNDSILHVPVNQTVRIDSLIDASNPTDSITDFVMAIMEEIRDENMVVERQLKQKEKEVLENDLTITLQLRQMLSSIESEEVINSLQKVRAQQSSLRKTTWLIIILGSLALITIIFFLINILKDLTRSQHYRQSLEEANAFSASLLKSKEQFMLSLTHDLKSPLSSIIGFTSLMEEKETIPQHRQYLQRIKKASDHILRLINDLLDLARLDTGKLQVENIPFNLKSLIIDVIESFRPQALEKPIDLTYELNIFPPANYRSDPLRITQILVNLISNALKFTEKGSVTIQVMTEKTSEDTDEVRIDIIDTGIGVPEEHLHHIFEEFGRVSSPTKQYEGTGLGLTITQKIVRLLNGSISLKSQPRQGSRFTVILPLKKVKQSEASLPEKRHADPNLSTVPIAGKKVWLVDDDVTLLEMTTKVLESAGLEVHSFNNPERAIHEFEKDCADLLITDIQMPGMDGFELAEQIIRKNGKSLRAIAMSGRNGAQNEHGNFSAFIRKPFLPKTLLLIVSGQFSGEGRSLPEVAYNQNTNTGNREYNLTQLAAFASGDPESLREILVSFIHSGKQNASLFAEYLKEKNEVGLSELAHKMLPLFRQLEANEIVQLLGQLEQKDFSKYNKMQLYAMGESALKKIEELLDTIRHEEELPAD